LLLALHRHELTVREIQAALKLPQSTVSRHLKVLTDIGLIQPRSEGTSNWYRMTARELTPQARKLWQVVRDELAGTPEARRDEERLERIVADRHLTSQRFFASAAGQWDKLRKDMFGERPELVALLGLLDSTWTVGDLGCGTGQLAATIAPFVRKVVAVDESAAMLKTAGQRARGLTNVELRHGTLEALPIAAGELDAALLVLVLHHASDPAAILAAAARALKPKGKLLVVDMVPHDHVEYREDMGHQWLGFDEPVLTGWALAAGFETPRFVALPAAAAAAGPGLFALTATAGACGG
jgi:ubiquinone/menaquinone biosynthesis C-methylase UbiE/DNA-binding transcriptional ArsR family regulator